MTLVCTVLFTLAFYNVRSVSAYTKHIVKRRSIYINVRKLYTMFEVQRELELNIVSYAAILFISVDAYTNHIVKRLLL